VSGLHHWFGGLHVIDSVQFSCRQGIVKAIIGPNGAGKTTLLNLIAGSLRPHSGSIAFDGHPIAGIAPHQVAARGI
jgi:branched-chain amino acid transport system ATP-binding protein